jgi:hypothetical protein
MNQRGRPAVRVRTDENLQTRTAVTAKTLAVPKENTATAVPRPIVGKVIGGLTGGARRAVLGDISNGAQTAQQKVLQHQTSAHDRLSLLPLDRSDSL